MSFTSSVDSYTGKSTSPSTADIVSGTVANIQTLDTVTGGAGTADEVIVTDSGILGAAATYLVGTGSGVTGFEKLTLQGTAGNAVYLNTAAGGFTTVTGSAGVDVFDVRTITSATTLTGGAGNDKLTVALTLAAASDLDKVSGVETIVLSAATTAGLTTKDALVATGSTLNLTLTGANTFDGSAETDGNFVITGGAGNSTYTLGKGNDQLTVGAGNDTIKVMTSASGLDKITNFDASGTDIIQFSAAGFTATGGAVSFAAAGATALDTVTAAGAAGTLLTAANHVIVWNVAPTTAANLNTALATQNGATAKEAFIIYTNTNGFTTIAYDSNIADATNTVVDLIQLAGVAATSVTAAELAFIA